MIVAIHISDKLFFKTKTVTRDEEGDYIIIKGSIHQDLKIINIYTHNMITHKDIYQLITNTNSFIKNLIIARDFNAPLILINRTYKQKIKKKTMVLNDTLDQKGITDSFRTFHPKAAEYTFL